MLQDQNSESDEFEKLLNQFIAEGFETIEEKQALHPARYALCQTEANKQTAAAPAHFRGYPSHGSSQGEETHR